MKESTTANDRRQKLRAIERTIALGLQAMRTTREASARSVAGRAVGKSPPAPDARQTAIQSWIDNALQEFKSVSLSDEWQAVLTETSFTHVGLSLTLGDFAVLKWRLREQREDAITGDDRTMIRVRTWLDVWGSMLIGQGLGHGRSECTSEEYREFSRGLNTHLQAATDWANGQNKLLGDLIGKSAATIEERCDEQLLPYHLRPVDAWHIGWAMSIAAWLLADVVGDAIPCGGNRLCRFPDAQAARRIHRESGVVSCPNCEGELTPAPRMRTMGSTDFVLVSAECESCELVIQFPEQALPKSLWNGPFLSLQSKNDHNQEETEIVPTTQKQDAPTMRKPRIFIGSSVEVLAVAENIQLGLDHQAECTLWSQGVFGLSGGTLDSLLRAVADYEFAVLVLTPDDLVHKRETTKNSPRDNVLFELGLFMGALGRERTYIVYCRDDKPDLPTDLAGVTAAMFGKRSDDNLQAALGPVCTQIKAAITMTRAEKGRV